MAYDPNDDSRPNFLAQPDDASNSERKRTWAAEATKYTALIACNFGLKVTNGFTCTSIWLMLSSFRQLSHKSSDHAFAYFAENFDPILDVFDNEGVRLGLQVHPSEMVLEVSTAHWLLRAIVRREPFGFNFDTSHLQWRRVDPAKFLREFRNGTYHVHMKDAALNLAGVSGIFASRLNFGRPAQGRAFRSLGQGSINLEGIIETPFRIGYEGPFPSSRGIAGWTTKRGRPKPTGSPSTWTSSHLLRCSTPALRIEACSG